MSDFRHKLRKEVVDPALTKGRKATITAVIVSRKKKNANSYKIEFLNENGKTQTKKSVRYRYHNESQPEGFEEGEIVLVEVDEKRYEIVGRYLNDDTASKANYELKADVYSNLMYDTTPGYIM